MSITFYYSNTIIYYNYLREINCLPNLRKFPDMLLFFMCYYDSEIKI